MSLSFKQGTLVWEGCLNGNFPLRKVRALNLETYVGKCQDLSNLAKAIAYAMALKPNERRHPVWVMARTYPLRNWAGTALVIANGSLLAIRFSPKMVATIPNLRVAVLAELGRIQEVPGHLYKIESALYDLK